MGGEGCRNYLLPSMSDRGSSGVRPAPLRTDGSNAFAHHSMAVRVPSIIEETIRRNADYPYAVSDELTMLRENIAADAPLRLFGPAAPDHDLWRLRFEPHGGETWLDTDWFFAEMLAYRLVMEAGRYWATLRDPFEPFKREEMASEDLWELLREALALQGSLEERLARTLLLNLWGNRIDLSLSNVAAKGTGASGEHLLADHTESAVRDLLDGNGAPVHIIMDNAGTEQAMDFVLADLLLSERAASHVILHVKMLPVLVSDVIPGDIRTMLEAMTSRGGAVRRLAERLTRRIGDGRLSVVPDFVWNTDTRLWELPPRLQRGFDEAALVVGKGDVNYRRAGNDAIWPLETTLAQAVGRFPAPLLLLRTLKSDTLLQVSTERAAELDASEPDWRTNGTYGVIQYAFGRSAAA